MPDHPKHINPIFRKKETKSYSIQECLAGISTDRMILSYLISKAESPLAADEDFILEVLEQLPIVGETRRVAVSGSPGVGKSTFINSYGNYLTHSGSKVAILPVDPTSQVSRGSILGDKTRMNHLIGNEHSFIKPMASSLALGGIAHATSTAIMLCERAGFDYIIIETVGVGQSEYAVRHLVDCFVLLLQPGGGDELQGIKRGIMEMADLLVINKADGPLLKSAEESLKSYKNALRLMLENDYAWKAKAISYSSVVEEATVSITALMDKYFTHMSARGRLEALRNEQALRYYVDMSEKLFLSAVGKHPEIRKQTEEHRAQILAHEIFPVKAVKELKEKLEHAFN